MSITYPERFMRRCATLVSWRQASPPYSVPLLVNGWHNSHGYANGLWMVHTMSLIHDDLPAMDNDECIGGDKP